MLTPKQLATNRLNSLKAIGPRTPEGKAASRFNASKHGINAKEQITFEESEADLANLTAEYQEQYQPANPTERLLVDTLVNNEWRLRRMRSAEAELWPYGASISVEKDPETIATSSGASFAETPDIFVGLQRVITSCERNYHRALKALQYPHAGSPQHPEVAVSARTAKPALFKPGSPVLVPFRQKSRTLTPAEVSYLL
jgi:hypothetical protein